MIRKVSTFRTAQPWDLIVLSVLCPNSSMQHEIQKHQGKNRKHGIVGSTPSSGVMDIGQAEHKEPQDGANVDVQLRPGGGLEGVDAPARRAPEVNPHIV